VVLSCVVAGCGGRGEPTLARSPVPAADAAPAALDAVPARDAGRPITEAHARTALARHFRAAGYRIREDVGVAGVTLDGCDPQRRIGYEYVAVEERGLDLTAESRAALAAADGWRVLILEATDLTGLDTRARAFLAELPDLPTRSGSGR